MVTQKNTLTVLTIILSIFLLFSVNFVLANILVASSTNQSSFTSINEDTMSLFNISINNTNTGQTANITQVNVTLPSSFTFNATTNATSVSVATFSNTTTNLSWTNTTTYLVNASSLEYFWFNATAATPGTYNLTITSLNATGTYLSNLSITVNDTTSPTIDYAATGNAVNNSIVSGTIPFNITSTDNVGVGTITVFLFYQNGTQVTNQTSSSSPFNGSFGGGFQDGTYFVNATVNDAAGNTNSTTTTLQTTYTINSFFYNGTVVNQAGSALNNALINVSFYDSSFQYVGSNATTSNGSGWFNLAVPSGSGWQFSPQITYNSSGDVTFVGQSLPYFPSQVLEDIAGTRFFLKPAGTINLTAINATGSPINFSYQIKDQKLGYIMADNLADNGKVYNVLAYVPRDRNYSIMIYPDQSMPVTYNWNNFSATENYNFDFLEISSYNATSKKVDKQFNMTMSYARVNGYINVTGYTTWENITVVPYLFEPGNMVHAAYGTIPYNLSAFFDQSDPTDHYNLTTGHFNISLPSTLETSSLLLFIVAKNGSNYYGGFRNVSLDYATYNNGANYTFENISLYGLLGEEANISLEGVAGPGKNVTTKLQTFNIINGTTNITYNDIQAHIEADVDYTNYGSTEFTWMADVEQGTNSTFTLPLLNVTGIDEMNIFASGNYEPKRKTYTVTQMNSNSNISLSTFNPGDIDGGKGASDIYVSFYISNSTCDVPLPSAGCTIGSSESMESFDPKSAIFGGGQISFRMGLPSSKIEVHYVNVDMLASGPPAALFDDTATNSTSGSFESALRFGSNGPTIYDHVLVSMPYTEGVVNTTTGLNESADVNLSIPLFYEDDFSSPIWNASVNGTNATFLAGNNSHYSTYASDWQTLMSNTTCTTNVSLFNATNPCYINTTDNRIWIRLPHFSGTSPTITGQVITVTENSQEEESSSSSSSGGGSSAVTTTSSADDLAKGFSKRIKLNGRVQLRIHNQTHYVKVIERTDTSVKLNITSDPIIVSLNVGEEKSIDVDFDGTNDFIVKLENINGVFVNLSFIETNTPVNGESSDDAQQDETNNAADTTENTVAETISDIVEEGFNLMWLWVVITIIIIGILVFMFRDAIFSALPKKDKKSKVFKN